MKYKLIILEPRSIILNILKHDCDFLGETKEVEIDTDHIFCVYDKVILDREQYYINHIELPIEGDDINKIYLVEYRYLVLMRITNVVVNEYLSDMEVNEICGDEIKYLDEIRMRCKTYEKK